MKKLKTFLQTPHPLNFSLKSVLAIGLAVFCILFFLKPFGFSRFSLPRAFGFSLAFGLITTLSMSLNFAISKRVFPQYFDETRWLISYEIVYQLCDTLVIGFMNTLFLTLLGVTKISFGQLLSKMEVNTLLIGFVPVLIFVIYGQNQALKNQLHKAEILNKELDQLTINEPSEQIITLHNENGKPELQLQANELIFIKSENNYLDVFFVNHEGNEVKHLLRNRIKNIAAVLPTEVFFQCHRSYIVNSKKILKVNRNARDLQLSLRGSKQVIPVSRSRSDALLAFLK